MIYINRMYETLRSHSVLTNRYVEEGVKNMDDVILYPDKVVDDSLAFLDKKEIECRLAEYGIKSMKYLINSDIKESDSLIFLDSRQLVYEQYHVSNIGTVPRVFIRAVNFQYISHKKSTFYQDIDNTFLPIVHTKFTSDFYKYNRYIAVGGFADKFQPKDNKEDFAMWAGRKGKGYDKAKMISNYINLKMYPVESSNLTADELFSKFDKAKVIISVADSEETFGNVIMQGISRGCIPLLPNKLCYPYMYPEEFLYNSMDECINKANLYINNYDLYWKKFGVILEQIVDYYQPERTMNRMLFLIR